MLGAGAAAIMTPSVYTARLRCVSHRYELVEVTREKLAREVDGDVKPVVVGCVDHVPLHWHYC